VKQYIDGLPLRVITDEVRLSQLSQQCEPHATSTSGTHFCLLPGTFVESVSPSMIYFVFRVV